MTADRRAAAAEERTAMELAREYGTRLLKEEVEPSDYLSSPMAHHSANLIRCVRVQAFLAGYEAGQRALIPLTTAAVEQARGIAGRAGTREGDGK